MIHWSKYTDRSLIKFVINSSITNFLRMLMNLYFLKTFLLKHSTEIDLYNNTIISIGFIFSLTTLSAGNILVNRFETFKKYDKDYFSLFLVTIIATAGFYIYILYNILFNQFNYLQFLAIITVFPNLLLHFLQNINNANLDYKVNNISSSISYVVIIILTYFSRYFDLKDQLMLSIYVVPLIYIPLIYIWTKQRTLFYSTSKNIFNAAGVNLKYNISNIIKNHIHIDIFHFFIFSSNITYIYFLIRYLSHNESSVIFELHFRYIILAQSLLSILYTSYIIPGLNHKIQSLQKYIVISLVSSIMLTTLYVAFARIYLNYDAKYITTNGLLLIFLKLSMFNLINISIYYKKYLLFIALSFLEIIGICLYFNSAVPL
jgi:hypothetical protein